ncbi:MAG: ABC transporter permease subunit [Pirellulaceae bacterium]
MGLSRVSIMTRVALPAAWPSIRVGLLLALTRALGETMAVVMVAGNVASIPTSLQAPIRTMTATIALELGYASADHRSVLFAIGTVMMLLVLGMVWLSGPRSRLMRAKPGEKPKTARSPWPDRLFSFGVTASAAVVVEAACGSSVISFGAAWVSFPSVS